MSYGRCLQTVIEIVRICEVKLKYKSKYIMLPITKYGSIIVLITAAKDAKMHLTIMQPKICIVLGEFKCSILLQTQTQRFISK